MIFHMSVDTNIFKTLKLRLATVGITDYLAARRAALKPRRLKLFRLVGVLGECRESYDNQR